MGAALGLVPLFVFGQSVFLLSLLQLPRKLVGNRAAFSKLQVFLDFFQNLVNLVRLLLFLLSILIHVRIHDPLKTRQTLALFIIYYSFPEKIRGFDRGRRVPHPFYFHVTIAKDDGEK